MLKILNLFPISTQKICLLSGARYRVGIYNGRWLTQYYNIIIDNPKRRSHVVSYFTGILKELGLKNHQDERTEILLNSKERKAVRQRLRNLKRKIVGIQPDREIQRRLWPARKFAKLADFLIEEYNL